MTCSWNILQINAETTAGGIAHWVTSLTTSELRTNATDFKDAWTPYIDAIIEATVPNQISNGGPVIGASAIKYGTARILIVIYCSCANRYEYLSKWLFLSLTSGQR